MKKYEKLMKRCLKLAEKAKGKTSPNPMVGAIIVDEECNIISEGYHKKWGDKHAEVNACNSADCSCEGKTIIVNLEPCSHYGKNPPCADMIIKNKFKRVIVGNIDPNPLVAGNGIKKLEEAGIEVIKGVLEEECSRLNEVFLKNHREKLPFVTIKTATTLDGKIATKTGSSKWITGEKARNEVQKIRGANDAIMTGSGTIIKDDPSLTCRTKNSKNPTRIIVDSKLKTNPKSNVYKDDGTRVIILTTANKTDKYPKNVEIFTCKEKNGHVDLKEAMKKLYKEGITSILVEAGAGLNSAFIKDKLADKLIQFIAPKIIGDKNAINFIESLEAKEIKDSIKLNHSQSKVIGEDIMCEYYFLKEK